MGILGQLKNAIMGASVDYRALIADGAMVIDVRTKDEFRQGHAKGSKNMPLSSISGKVGQLEGKTVILVCRSGARAGQVKDFLQSSGITAHNAGAWQNVA